LLAVSPGSETSAATLIAAVRSRLHCSTYAQENCAELTFTGHANAQ